MRREADQRIAAATASHSDAAEQLARSYDERIDSLRRELAADAARRAEADARAAALKAAHEKALEAARSDAREAAARLDVARAQVAQLQQAAAAARAEAAAARAAADRAQQVRCSLLALQGGPRATPTYGCFVRLGLQQA